ncbi:hypothetical protein ACFWD7_23580 [Streptomyces mirabilis]|uniref:hypothetical protein n=1 Tax=Streptomyces mirabilis TaxID=68239 RepID=UPI0036C0C58E
MTERGLSTPAVERIIRARSTPPSSRWPADKAEKVPDAQARAQALLRRLADARRFESVVAVKRVCDDIAALAGTDHGTQAQLATALDDADYWLKGQAEVRRDLFARLDEAVTAGNAKHVRRLLVRVNATASHDRAASEAAIADAVAGHVTSFAREQQAQVAAQRQTRNGSWAGHERVQRVLGNLRRRDPGVMNTEMRGLVEVLVQAAGEAGNRVTAGQEEEIADWKERADLSQPAPAALAAAAQRTRNKQDAVAQPSKQERPLHEQVARRFWIKRNCPRCQRPRPRTALLTTRPVSACCARFRMMSAFS